jgi:hypothetical protein
VINIDLQRVLNLMNKKFRVKDRKSKERVQEEMVKHSFSNWHNETRTTKLTPTDCLKSWDFLVLWGRPVCPNQATMWPPHDHHPLNVRCKGRSCLSVQIKSLEFILKCERRTRVTIAVRNLLSVFDTTPQVLEFFLANYLWSRSIIYCSYSSFVTTKHHALMCW